MNDSARSQLDACSDLYLISYEEAPEEMDLTLKVAEARTQWDVEAEKTGDEVLDIAFRGAHPVLTKAGYSEFTIVFEDYICFAVSNETYVEPEPDEDYGKKLRYYEKSKFLDYIRNATWATNEFPGLILHYAVTCNRHIVNVACMREPVVLRRVITADEIKGSLR